MTANRNQLLWVGAHWNCAPAVWLRRVTPHFFTGGNLAARISGSQLVGVLRRLKSFAILRGRAGDDFHPVAAIAGTGKTRVARCARFLSSILTHNTTEEKEQLDQTQQ